MILMDEYVDQGVSGKFIEGRYELQRLMADAKTRKFDEVLVWKTNRLARNLLDLQRILQTLKRYNVSFRSLTEPFETVTPAGKLLFNVLGSISEFERCTIVQNVKMGMRQRALERGQGPRARQRSQPFRQGGQNPRCGPRGGRCRPPDLQAVRRREGAESHRKPAQPGSRPHEERERLQHLCRGRHHGQPHLCGQDSVREVPGLVEQAAQGQKRTRAGGRAPRTDHRAGTLGEGQGPAATEKFPPQPDLRRRASAHRPDALPGLRGRHGSQPDKSNGVNADAVEAAVFRRIREAVERPKVLRDVIRRINERRQRSLEPLRKELEALKKSLDKTEGSRQKYFRLYEEDAIDKDKLVGRMEELRVERAAFEQRKAQIEAELRSCSAEPLPFEVVKEALGHFDRLLRSGTSDQRKTLLQLFLKEIVLTKDRKIERIEIRFDENVEAHLAQEAPSAATSTEGASPRFRRVSRGRIPNFVLTL